MDIKAAPYSLCPRILTRGGTGLPDIIVMIFLTNIVPSYTLCCDVEYVCLLSASLAMFTLLIKLIKLTILPNSDFLLKYFLMIFKIWFISNIGQQSYRCSHATLLRSNSKVNLAHCCVL